MYIMAETKIEKEGNDIYYITSILQAYGWFWVKNTIEIKLRQQAHHKSE